MVEIPVGLRHVVKEVARELVVVARLPDLHSRPNVILARLPPGVVVALALFVLAQVAAPVRKR